MNDPGALRAPGGTRASIDLDLAHPGADAALVRFRDAEMTLHLTRREATPAAVSRRDELCSPTYWWDTDESPRYAEADQAMAEGERARNKGTEAEVGLPSTAVAASAEVCVWATQAYIAARSRFLAAHSTMVGIRNRNSEVFHG